MKYPVDMTVNGRACHVEVEARALLVHVLRDELGLTGSHVGCETSSCGACTVLCDGKTLKACTRLAVQADGASIVTLEGLAAEAERAGLETSQGLHPLQEALAARRALPCGFCAAGMLLVAREALERDPGADAASIRRALSGAICPCTDYERVVQAVISAATALMVESAVEEPA